jgi:hypothetical protein
MPLRDGLTFLLGTAISAPVPKKTLVVEKAAGDLSWNRRQ